MDNSRFAELAKAAKELSSAKVWDGFIDAIVQCTEKQRRQLVRTYEMMTRLNMVDVLADYAAALDKSADALTDEEKKEAFLKHVLQRSNP